jgi:hypothetical protein
MKLGARKFFHKKINDFEFHFQNIIQNPRCQEDIEGLRGRAESA